MSDESLEQPHRYPSVPTKATATNLAAQSELSATHCSVARPIHLVITFDEIREIYVLAQRVVQSRQNVGTAMKEQARKVIVIVRRVNSTMPPNDLSQATASGAKARKVNEPEN
jgi:hypothetical protein